MKSLKGEHSLGSTVYLDTDYWQEEYSLGSTVYLDTDYWQEEYSLGSTVYLDTDYWQEEHSLGSTVYLELTCTVSDVACDVTLRNINKRFKPFLLNPHPTLCHQT